MCVRCVIYDVRAGVCVTKCVAECACGMSARCVCICDGM